MRYVILSIFFLALVGCQPSEQASEEAAPEPTPEEAASDAGSMDPTVTESNHYAVEFENDHVRVLRITYAASDESGLHSHPNGVLVSLSDASAALTLEDGTEREDNFTTGETIWAPAETHSGKATTDLELILIELKGSAG